MNMNYLAGGLAVVLIMLGAGYWYTQQSRDIKVVQTDENQNITPTTTPPVVDTTKTVLGKSVKGREITAYHFGTGAKEVVFVGGLHGGYSWNTALLGLDLVEYYQKNPTAIPNGVKVTVIPVANPDGLETVVGTSSRFSKVDVSKVEATRTTGRFNANRVDLNRNFDCDWKATATWQNTSVSGGDAAFSEPESQALRTYMEARKPAAVVVWFSAAGGVYPSKCTDSPSAESLALTNEYAKASGYKAYADFDFYEVTGDMPNWLSKINIPAISVLLTTREDTEWTKNLKGIEAVLKRYAQ